MRNRLRTRWIDPSTRKSMPNVRLIAFSSRDSAAKRASDIKYIVSVNGAFTAQLPAALKAAIRAQVHEPIHAQHPLDGMFRALRGLIRLLCIAGLNGTQQHPVDMASGGLNYEFNEVIAIETITG